MLFVSLGKAEKQSQKRLEVEKCLQSKDNCGNLLIGMMISFPELILIPQMGRGGKNNR